MGGLLFLASQVITLTECPWMLDSAVILRTSPPHSRTPDSPPSDKQGHLDFSDYSGIAGQRLYSTSWCDSQSL